MSRHKMVVDIPHGPKDMGAEITAEIAFSFTPGSAPIIYPADNACPGWGPEIEFLSAAPMCNGKPAPFLDYAGLQQKTLNDLAEDWLYSDEGQAAAMAEVAAEAEDARAFIAELRKEAP